MHVRETLIWVKNTIVLGRQDYQWMYEPCLYGWKDGAAHYFVKDRTQRTVFEKDSADLERLEKADLIGLLEEAYACINTDVIHADKPMANRMHPTMKPIELIGKFIANSSKPGDIVVDTFGGSGSTMIAAEQLGRRCCMTEMDARYCDVIIKRWEYLTGGHAKKL